MSNYRLVSYYLASRNEAGWLPSCEHCGHDIKHCYVIKDVSGVTKTVGSECVRHFLSGEQQYTADVMKKRVSRAGRQWRDANNGKKAPAILDGETRKKYIERRVIEMSNAYTAFMMWSRFCNKHQSAYNYSRKVWNRFNRMFSDSTIATNRDNFYTPYYRAVSRIARKYNANSYDFTRPVWDIKKI